MQPPVIPEADSSEAVRDLVKRVEPYCGRSRLGALLAFRSHRSDRDDGWLRLWALLALLLVPAPLVAHARTVVDSAGRRVEVPDRIKKVFAAGPPASILLYMLAPEKM